MEKRREQLGRDAAYHMSRAEARRKKANGAFSELKSICEFRKGDLGEEPMVSVNICSYHDIEIICTMSNCPYLPKNV